MVQHNGHGGSSGRDQPALRRPIVDVTVAPYNAGKGADDTFAIQAAINATPPGGTTLVPAEATCLVNPLAHTDVLYINCPTGLLLKSDITLQVDGVLQAIANNSPRYVIVFIRDGLSNVTITGKGKIIGDRDHHTVVDNPTSQWGFGLVIGAAQNVRVGGGLTISKCFGDGITINGSKNLTIDHVTLDSNARQNMSLGAVDELVLTNITSSNPGMVGFDFEPDLAAQTISNVKVQYCNFINSGTLGVKGSKKVHIGLGSEPGIGIFKNITISDCQFDLKQQPIWAHDTAGTTGIPPEAYLLNVIFYQGLKADWYRFWGYPTSWSHS